MLALYVLPLRVDTDEAIGAASIDLPIWCVGGLGFDVGDGSDVACCALVSLKPSCSPS